MRNPKLDTFLQYHYKGFDGKKAWSNRPPFYSGHPCPINLEESTNNLIDSLDVFIDLNIKYTLVFGTLLGIYRDGDLIKHDTDTDIAVWLDNEESMMQAILNLESKGFLLTRFTEKIITFLRGENGDYIDFYLYKDEGSESGSLTAFEEYGTLEKSDFSESVIEWKGRQFSCVENPEEYFNKIYGSGWRKPVINLHADINNDSCTFEEIQERYNG